ncbi:restriction endonuclease subunit S [Chryseomicrobium sp. FSL W7-1435]|uniref:restriction endonuclease subunit S n=1 Tax=Chryseomicrobium sp. FSL W7-1435 TaxID=2921704 RepID=UPI00315A7DFB
MRYKLADVAEINPSNSVNISSFEKIRYLDTANLNQGKIDKLVEYTRGIDKVPSRAKRLVKCNDILYSTVRPNQKHFGIYKYQAEIIASTGFAHLRVDINKADPDYVYWLLTQEKVIDYLQAIAEASTSTYPSIKPSVIGHLEFDFPSLIKQKKAVEVLNNISRKIDINNQLVKRLEDISQTIYKHWFIDFEFPNENGQPYKSSGGKMVESELGMIPYSWEYRELDEISNVKIGRTPPRKEAEWFTDNSVGVKWVSIKDMGNSIGPYIFESSENLTYEAVTKFKINIVPENTLIMSFKLTVGRLNITDERLATNEAIASFEFKDPDLFTEYLYLYLSNFDFNSLGNTSSIGTAVNSKVVKKIKVLIPDSQILQALKKEIIPLFELIKLKTKEINTLNSLRNILLPKLLSGEIELPIKENVEN